MLKKKVTGTFLDNEPMTKHTSYGIGGPVRAYITPANQEDLVTILRFAQEKDIPTFFAGSGSNLLVADEGFDGIVITLGKTFTRLRIVGNSVEAEVGVMLGKMVKEIRKIESGLGDGIKKPTTSELVTQQAVRKSLYARIPIKAGELFTEHNLTTKRPQSGISPMEYWRILGTVSRISYAKDEQIR